MTIISYLLLQFVLLGRIIFFMIAIFLKVDEN